MHIVRQDGTIAAVAKDSFIITFPSKKFETPEERVYVPTLDPLKESLVPQTAPTGAYLFFGPIKVLNSSDIMH